MSDHIRDLAEEANNADDAVWFKDNSSMICRALSAHVELLDEVARLRRDEEWRPAYLRISAELAKRTSRELKAVQILNDGLGRLKLTDAGDELIREALDCFSGF